MNGFGVSRSFVLGVVIVAAAEGFHGPCLAQTANERYVVVNQDNTQLRSGNLDTYYAVGSLKAGTVLWADENMSGWLRVSYPIEGEALCLADACTPSSDGRTITVNDLGGLKAINPKFGLKGSWRTLTLAEGLDAGATLRVLGSESTTDGSKRAFKVAVPGQARAFVRESAVRTASAAEQSAHVARLESLSVTPPHVLAQAARDNAPRITSAPPTNPANSGGDTAGAGNQAQNQTNPTTPTNVAAAPDASNQTPSPVPANTANQPDRITELMVAFDNVRSQPVMSAEVTPLIAEYEKAIAELTDAPLIESTRAALQQRLALLQALRGIQENRIALENAKQAADQSATDLARQNQELDSQRRFDVVGRLTTSSVYAGGSQPLLYRIESTDGGSPRTLAYIKPTDALKVGEMLGRVVGIIRGSTHKQSEVVNVIEPSAVELIAGGT